MEDSIQEPEENKEDIKGLHFICPNCGKISREDVIFLCNTCKQSELIFKDGVYICPSCLMPGENFECFKCGSKDVKISPKDKKELLSKER